MLRLESIGKSFGEFRLEPVSLEVAPGEFFCLLGPSGCGKTTVLRIVAGFERPDVGAVQLDGTAITDRPPHERHMHTVFQRYALFPHLNVYENVAFPLRLAKTPKEELDRRVNEALDLVEIRALAHRRSRELSGGQAQRVALARALISRPRVLLLDEPLSALDPELRVRMRDELKALCRRVGTTFVMVTHDQEEALHLSDRMAVLKAGRCLQVGTPKEIYEEPATRFVARFIGPANEVTGEVSLVETPAPTPLATPAPTPVLAAPVEGASAETLPPPVAPPPATPPAPPAPTYRLVASVGTFGVRKGEAFVGKKASLLVRPEKMRLLRHKPSPVPEALIEGNVEDIRYLGSRTDYAVRAGELTFKVFEPELDRLKKRTLKSGDRVYLTWRPEDAILLPAEET